jgi:hypothetical protein
MDRNGLLQAAQKHSCRCELSSALGIEVASREMDQMEVLQIALEQSHHCDWSDSVIDVGNRLISTDQESVDSGGVGERRWLKTGRRTIT